uniref:Zinc finger protein 217 n=1 Tax=Fundulus heteroclitus TaxID=8078 RepID=A0A3Q2PK28_FUNHE
MPTHSLLPFVDTPDGLLQDIPISNNAGVPAPGGSMTPQGACVAKAGSHPDDGAQLSCMFCDQAFADPEELGPHVLRHHPTTFYEPTVLRVDAEFRIPGERSRPKAGALTAPKEEAPSCIVCGQVAQDAGELEAHMRKHKDYFTYCCSVCGRRFRESWFLKNHMKMHVKPGPKSKAALDQEAPFTVNGVTQEPPAEPVLSLYEMCMVCGFFFPDRHSLAEHSKVHNREAEPGRDEAKEKPGGAAEPLAKQEAFLGSLNLRPASASERLNDARSSKWVPQLDPFTTYQAWQLATKGKIAVGPNNTKDIGQELSTDNEDCGSDKEETGAAWCEGQADRAGKEARSQQQAAAEASNPPRRSLMQKHKDKERPTTCEECQKTFRTYHQLVLHSRIHKRERGGQDSPTSADGKPARAAPAEPAEDGQEEALEEHLVSGEDGLERSKFRSKECNYCRKSFRSSYYLTVHMRTHTGEKPYKCAYCNYAAAQKTSLKYHYDRRHKDKPYVEISSRSVPSLPSPDGLPAPSRPKLWDSEADRKPEGRVAVLDSKPDERVEQVMPAPSDLQAGRPAAVDLKEEEEEDGDSAAPLNLSLKASVSAAAASETRCAVTPTSCSLCAYKTLYPEVLAMHKRLLHKDKSQSAKKNESGGSVKPRRHTGCPPALDGKDVAPFQTTDRPHPRRTKSPPPQPPRPQDGPPVGAPHAQKRSPVPAARQDAATGSQRHRQNADPHPSQEPSRYTEVVRKSVAGGKSAADRTAPLDRPPVADRSYQARSGTVWHPDAARLCLSSRFGGLPQMDFGDPSGKRMKFSVPSSREVETGEKMSFRAPPVDGPNRPPVQGRSAKPASQGPGPSSASEALCPIKTGSAPLGGGLESDWSMMSFLHYSPSELASLYHSAPANPSHAGAANARAGPRTLLYQPLPGLPNLQWRDSSAAFPNQRYGTTDKSS